MIFADALADEEARQTTLHAEKEGAAIRGLLATPAHKLTAAQKLKLDEVLNVGPMPLGYPAGGQKSTGSGAPRRGRASLPSLASTSTLRAAWRPAGYS